MLDVSVSFPDGSDKSLSFSDLVKQSNYTILYFYPKDNTSGCTIEAKDFSGLVDRFSSYDVQIVGVSKDSHKSHCWFMDKHGLLFPLISDPEWLLHNQFGAVGEKSLYGKTYTGTIRSTFILDTNGDILHQRTKVRVKWHVQEVLDYVVQHLA